MNKRPHRRRTLTFAQSIYSTMASQCLRQKCSFSWRYLDPGLTQGSFRPHKSAPPNGISIGSAVFARLSRVPNAHHTRRHTRTRARFISSGDTHPETDHSPNRGTNIHSQKLKQHYSKTVSSTNVYFLIFSILRVFPCVVLIF